MSKPTPLEYRMRSAYKTLQQIKNEMGGHQLVQIGEGHLITCDKRMKEIRTAAKKAGIKLKE